MIRAVQMENSTFKLGNDSTFIFIRLPDRRLAVQSLHRSGGHSFSSQIKIGTSKLATSRDHEEPNPNSSPSLETARANPTLDNSIPANKEGPITNMGES